MILSASRRTDIPAFFGEWFINRLHAGEVMVRNPMNFKHISRIRLSPDTVDCIVFWTKNPESFLKYLPDVDSLGYKYYFLFTLNSYDKTIEAGVDSKQKIINTFSQLSELIGPEKIIWRYDPILVSDRFDKEYHFKWFKYLAERLSPFTRRCIISFVDIYKKIEQNMKLVNATSPDDKLIHEFASKFGEISYVNQLQLFSCSHELDLSAYGISHSKCIDDELISHLIGYNIDAKKDSSQRDECGCIESKDIGSYNTCIHNCLYCYANTKVQTARKNCEKYDPNSPLLCDSLRGDEKISDYVEKKKTNGNKSVQRSLFLQNSKG